MWTFSGVAAAAPASKAGQGDSARPHDGTSSHVTECSPSHHSSTGHGANTDGADNPYHNTCEQEHAPGNGGGDGNANGKPCAGCVGNADDKNPPGQAPGGSDHNAGYECDRNQGVGKENPAHTGCGAATPPPDGNDNGNDGSQTPVCPAGAAAMTGHEFALDGSVGDIDDVTPGDEVEVTFTIAAGCHDIDLSLASYGAARTLSDSDTGTFGAGTHTLVVDTPGCATEVDFVFGGVVPTLGAAEGSPYNDQGRLIEAGSGTSSCAPSGFDGSDPRNQGNTISNTPNGSTTSNPSATSGSPGSVTLAPAVSATAGAPTVSSTSALPAVLGMQLGGGGSVGDALTRGRPAEVLGVQIERPATGSLARTGAGTAPLVSIGALLCIAGFGLASVRDRKQTVSVAARLAGHVAVA